MSLIPIGQAARQRIADWRNERRICLAANACKAAMAAGDKGEARKHWYAMTDVIKARSPAQAARMERKAGIRHA